MANMLNDSRQGNRPSLGVIGLGRVGKIILKSLLEISNLPMVRAYSRTRQNGFVEELTHINQYGTPVMVDDEIADISANDIIFIARSIDYAALIKGKMVNDSWVLEMEGNLALIEQLMPSLIALKHKAIVVYTNPVDILCTYLVRELHPSNKVIGFGNSLDTMRLRNLTSIKGMVVGEHGVGMVPLGVSDQRHEILAARERILRSVAAVVQGQGYTHLGPELATREFLHALLDGQDRALSMSIHQPDIGICMGSPCMVGGGEVLPIAWEMNQAEQSLWIESAVKIKRDMEKTGI